MGTGLRPYGGRHLWERRRVHARAVAHAAHAFKRAGLRPGRVVAELQYFHGPIRQVRAATIPLSSGERNFAGNYEKNCKSIIEIAEIQAISKFLPKCKIYIGLGSV